MNATVEAVKPAKIMRTPNLTVEIREAGYAVIMNGTCRVGHSEIDEYGCWAVYADNFNVSRLLGRGVKLTQQVHRFASVLKMAQI